jgi:RNA polymerase sigma factor (TIGR02999 family)
VSAVTVLLEQANRGDAEALRRLMPLVYDELRQLASAKMARESASQTLQATALVHEAWLRLGGDAQPAWQNRRHFFAAAAEAMRRILVERARRRLAVRHGGGQQRVEEELETLPQLGPDDQVLKLDDALQRLAALDADKAELVKLRFFTGLSFEEAALTLGVSVPTAHRWWAFARAWLLDEMRRT